ncbi:WYL domain-containing protein [Bermanella marisrubri]|uniref:Uncharacterized protein n=1 Tax=Bermanella marisrubri TaxID=207949 RepID=Q1MYU1_9GAMM|nr:WYL domain-containing protein [Bermanella marisrubri]EAT11115.1 hypothetical protein RED65_04954 [Oceanobacter sp. RED65] [Bermanella marisrubri]QIZ83443.1 WYL domain-containing protein [Bermanella marisrubri]
MEGYLTQKENSSATEHKRFAFLELMLIWEGCVSAKQIQSQFEISDRLAEIIIKKYKELYPDNIAYSGEKRAYIPTPQMVAQFSDGTLQDYVQIIADHAMVSELPLPKRRIDPAFVRPILLAIREQKRLKIDYASVSNPNFSQRIIQPHHLVFDGIRWHVRAYCEKNQGFRDFVLSRIDPAFGGELLDGADHYDIEDEDWNAFVDVEIQPDARLEENRKHLIALDYEMTEQNGEYRKTVHVRKAMLMYFLRRMGLDQYHQKPEVQQITLTAHCQAQLKL